MLRLAGGGTQGGLNVAGTGGHECPPYNLVGWLSRQSVHCGKKPDIGIRDVGLDWFELLQRTYRTGMISMALICGFSIWVVNLMLSSPSVISTGTVSM
jgi:hypothetical protein